MAKTESFNLKGRGRVAIHNGSAPWGQLLLLPQPSQQGCCWETKPPRMAHQFPKVAKQTGHKFSFSLLLALGDVQPSLERSIRLFCSGDPQATKSLPGVEDLDSLVGKAPRQPPSPPDKGFLGAHPKRKSLSLSLPTSQRWLCSPCQDLAWHPSAWVSAGGDGVAHPPPHFSLPKGRGRRVP